MKRLTLICVVAMSIGLTACIGHVEKKVNALVDMEFTSEQLSRSARDLGCRAAMVVRQGDTASVLYLDPRSQRAFTMTYVSHDGGYSGRGEQYKLDTVNAFNPSYERHGDTAATLVIGDPEAVLELEYIERGADSMCLSLPMEGEQPFAVRLKLYDGYLAGSDPLADPDIQRLLVLGLTLRYPVEEITADQSRNDSLTRSLDSLAEAIDRSAEAMGNMLTDSLLEQTVGLGDEWHAIVEEASSLGFHDQRLYQTPGKTTITLRGDRCKADECHERMLRLAELTGQTGMRYSIQHRPWHRKCRFVVEVENGSRQDN